MIGKKRLVESDNETDESMADLTLIENKDD